MSGEAASRGVLIRDLILLQIKLALDGLKDVVLFQASLAAAIIDLIFMPHTRGRCFYSVLRFSERVDLWLNLHGAAQRAGGNRDGLFGVSRAGDDTFLGKLEELVREKETDLDTRTQPRPAARAA